MVFVGFIMATDSSRVSVNYMYIESEVEVYRRGLVEFGEAVYRSTIEEYKTIINWPDHDAAR